MFFHIHNQLNYFSCQNRMSVVISANLALVKIFLVVSRLSPPLFIEISALFCLLFKLLDYKYDSSCNYEYVLDNKSLENLTE